MRGNRPALRFLLLLAVVLGVAAMHTLGHSSGSGHHPAAATVDHGPTMAGKENRMLVAGSGPASTADGADRPGAAPLDPGGGSDGHLNPLSICLAVFGALFVVALGLAALRQRATRVRRVGVGRYGTPPGRAPPPVPIGLRVADLSVLRT